MDIDYIFWCQVAILEVQYYTYNTMLDKFHIRKSAHGTKNEDYISSGIRDMTIFRIPTWRR